MDFVLSELTVVLNRSIFLASPCSSLVSLSLSFATFFSNSVPQITPIPSFFSNSWMYIPNAFEMNLPNFEGSFNLDII